MTTRSAGNTGVPHPGVPLVQSLDVDEGHFPVGSRHDAIMLTTDDQVDVISKLPPAIPVCDRGNFVLIHVILHKRVWVGKVVSFFPLQK